jgi:hypothetical protein
MKKTSLAKFLFFALFTISTLGFLSSCSKDDENTDTVHKVSFKVTASDGVQIEQIILLTGATTSTFDTVSGTTWTSEEYSVKKSEGAAQIMASANGVDGTSTLKAEIIVDGVVVKESTSQGVSPTVQVSYLFPQ